MPLFALAMSKGSEVSNGSSLGVSSGTVLGVSPGVSWVCLLPLGLAVVVIVGCRRVGLGHRLAKGHHREGRPIGGRPGKAAPRRVGDHYSDAGASKPRAEKPSPLPLEPLACMFAPLNLFFALFLYLYAIESYGYGARPLEYPLVVAAGVAVAAVMLRACRPPARWGRFAVALFKALLLIVALILATALLAGLVYDVFDLSSAFTYISPIDTCLDDVLTTVFVLFVVAAASVAASAEAPRPPRLASEVSAFLEEWGHYFPVPRQIKAPGAIARSFACLGATVATLFIATAPGAISGVSRVATLALSIVAIALASRGYLPYVLALLLGVALWVVGVLFFTKAGGYYSGRLVIWMFGFSAPSLDGAIGQVVQRASGFASLFAASGLIGSGDISPAARTAFYTLTSSIFPEVSSAYGNAGLMAVLLGAVAILASGVRWVRAMGVPSGSKGHMRARQDRLVCTGLMVLLVSPMAIDLLVIVGLSPLMLAVPLLSGGLARTFRCIALGGFATLISCKEPKAEPAPPALGTDGSASAEPQRHTDDGPATLTSGVPKLGGFVQRCCGR